MLLERTVSLTSISEIEWPDMRRPMARSGKKSKEKRDRKTGLNRRRKGREERKAREGFVLHSSRWGVAGRLDRAA